MTHTPETMREAAAKVAENAADNGVSYQALWRVAAAIRAIPLPPAPPMEAMAERMEAALRGVDDDYMTSENHHPGYVLIPFAKFHEMCAVLADLDAWRAKGGA